MDIIQAESGCNKPRMHREHVNITKVVAKSKSSSQEVSTPVPKTDVDEVSRKFDAKSIHEEWVDELGEVIPSFKDIRQEIGKQRKRSRFKKYRRIMCNDHFKQGIKPIKLEFGTKMARIGTVSSESTPELVPAPFESILKGVVTTIK